MNVDDGRPVTLTVQTSLKRENRNKEAHRSRMGMVGKTSLPLKDARSRFS